MVQTYIARWGILGCGAISGAFVRDLCRSQSDRGATDVAHAVVALGSRDKDRAEVFRKTFCPEGGSAQKTGLTSVPTTVYGSYLEVVQNNDVDIIYVGTVHTAHYDDVKLALDNGKHVLVEKPATLNAAEWASLVKLARSKNLFLFEGMWTRFLPCTRAIVQAVHHDHAIGDVRAVWAEFCMDHYDKLPDTNRTIAAELAGGGMLDVGPYPMVWANTLLFHHPANAQAMPKVSSMMQLGRTGVDIHTAWNMSFPKLNAVAYCVTNLVSSSPRQNVRIAGTLGEIIVTGIHSARPESFVFRRFKDASKGAGGGVDEQAFDHNFEGFGLMFEADEAARCLRDGKLESDGYKQAETQMIMEMFDRMRQEGGYVFPEGLERVK